MMSSRWPRPIGVMASMALIPVWRGWFTGWRFTTEGAWSSSTRCSSNRIGPLASSGRPRGSMTRPSTPSPTPTESTLPVRLTGWPSSIPSASPRTTTPISSSSRLNASPYTPSENSRSSRAMAPGRPATRAIPSPVSTTRPTSWRSVSGRKPSTCLRSASAMSFGSIVSSANSHLAQPLAGQLQPPTDRAVDHLVAHPGHHAPHDRGVHHHLHLYLLPGGPLQGPGQLVAPGRVERDRRPNLRHFALPALRGELGEFVHDGLQLPGPALLHHERQEVHGVRVGPVPEDLLQQRSLPLGWQVDVGERRAEVRLTLQGPGETEQLVLDLVQDVLGLGHREQGLGVAADRLVPGHPLLVSLFGAAVPVAGGGLHLGELVDVPVDQSHLLLLVELGADHPRGQLHGELPDLAAELPERPVALGPDLLLGPGHDLVGLVLGLRQEVPAHRLAGPP